MEKFLHDYGVDLVIWAHEHSYERLWPLYKYKVQNGSYAEPYRNPRAPVHIITGSAVSLITIKMCSSYAVSCAVTDFIAVMVKVEMYTSET